MMATASYWTGRKQYWDATREEITEHPPQT